MRSDVLYFCVLNSYDRTTGVHNREWLPLCFLNCISILRRNGIEGRLINESEISDLPVGSSIVVTTGSIDRWFAPSIRVDALYRFCERYCGRHRVFLSGIHATLFPDVLLEKTHAAGIIRGMPEAAIESFCKTGVLAGDFRSSSPDLSTFPVPAFDQVNAGYFAFRAMGWERFGVFEFSRGCKESCDFCAKTCFYGDTDTCKTPEGMLRELKIAVEEHGFRTGYFMDICFLNHRSAVERLCELLAASKLDFTWACETRLKDLDDEILDLLHAAGCRMIGFGVDELNATSDLVEKIEKRGIKTLAYYIVSGLFASPTPADQRVFEMMWSVDSTFANPRRFLDLKNHAWLAEEIIKDVPYRQDELDLRIRREILRFHLAPRRLFRILKGLGIANTVRAARSFGNLLLRR